MFDNPKICITQAQPNDAGVIFKFICELENQTFDFVSFLDVYNKNINNPQNIYYIAFSDNSPAGFISFHTQYLLHHCGKVGEIQEFFVDPLYRNRGIGKLLFQEIIKFSRTNGIMFIEVTSNKVRTENIMVYSQLGFELTHNKFTMTLT
jgi:PhnO protein